MGNIQFSTWQEVFDHCLKTLRDRYPNYSEGQLADISGIPRATLNRQKNHPSKPSLENYFRALSSLGDPKLIEIGLALYDESPGSPMKKVIEVSLMEGKKKFVQIDLERLFENRDIFIAYLLASQNSGATFDQIQNVLGSPAQDSINILLKKDLIKEDNRKYFVDGENILIRSFESIKYHLNSYARYYKTEHVGKEMNYIHSLSEGLNREGQKNLHELHKKFHNEVQTLMRDPKNIGDIPAFSVSFCDTFTTLNNGGANE
jgi:hypothetical protein